MLERNIPSYLAVCHADDRNGWSEFRELFSRHTGSDREFEFRTLEDTTVSSGDDEAVYIWLYQGDVAASAGGVLGKALEPGDAIALGPGMSCILDGKGDFWISRKRHVCRIPFTGISCIRDLEDTSGGCNNAENAFRRLQIVWENAEGGNPDGDNAMGCHVVWIAEASSRSHYHPVPPVPGGENQHEMYLVLDPEHFGLKGDVGTPGVWTYPEVGNWDRYDFTPLNPGDAVYIPPGVVHRAVDVLACVVAIPGFKPDNELFVDQRIYDESGGNAPCNLNVIKEASL